MSDSTVIEDAVLAFVHDELLFDTDDEVGLNDELLLEGIIDSLGAIRLVGFIESTWALNVPPQDVTVDNFGSIAQIASYVRRRGGGDAATL